MSTDRVDLDRAGGAGAGVEGGLTTLVGGVAELFQSDLDVGRHVVERLADLAGPGVLVEDLSYGAIPVVHRLQETTPDALVLVGASRRGRPPGTIERRVVRGTDRTAEQLQGAVRDAGTGYVDLALTLDVIHGLEQAPPRVVVFEIEPARTDPGEGLSPEATAAVERATAAIGDEVALVPLFDLLGLLRERVAVLAPTAQAPLAALRDLVAALDELDELDENGRWGRTLTEAERLRRAIADGAHHPEMDHRDWGLIWGVLEELQRRGARSLTDLT